MSVLRATSRPPTASRHPGAPPILLSIRATPHLSCVNARPSSSGIFATLIGDRYCAASPRQLHCEMAGYRWCGARLVAPRRRAASDSQLVAAPHPAERYGSANTSCRMGAASAVMRSRASSRRPSNVRLSSTELAEITHAGSGTPSAPIGPVMLASKRSLK